jgi:hypothetical protein
MSIKSTAWLHWPLAYVVRPLSFASNAEEIHARLWYDPREWVRRAFMITTIVGSLMVSLPALSSVRNMFPDGVMSFAEYAFLIDVRMLTQPWRVLALVTAFITLALTWYGFELSVLLRPNVQKFDDGRRSKLWAAAFEYGMRVREICAWLFWVLILIHGYLWLAPSTDWLPLYVRELLQVIYGDFLPPQLR